MGRARPSRKVPRATGQTATGAVGTVDGPKSSTLGRGRTDEMGLEV